MIRESINEGGWGIPDIPGLPTPDEADFIEILENVRGEDIFAVQSTSNPSNQHLMELLKLKKSRKFSQLF